MGSIIENEEQENKEMGSLIIKAMLYTTIEELQKAFNLEYHVNKLVFLKNHSGIIKKGIVKGVKRISKNNYEADERY